MIDRKIAYLIVFIIPSIGVLIGCNPSVEDRPDFRVVHLSGSPYEMGHQHGTTLRSELRALYTRYLTALVFPYVDREKATYTGFFPYYVRNDKFKGAGFAYEYLKESALEMEKHIPPQYLEEIRGIADGAGMKYEEILILNTFLDALLSTLAIRSFLISTEAPELTEIRFDSKITEDDRDNDEDGVVDEADESIIKYEPLPYALMREVPVNPTITLKIEDASGIDAETVRLWINGEVFQKGSENVEIKESEGGMELTVESVGEWPEASVVVMEFRAGDRDLIEDPPPVHANFSRTERWVFSTKGYGESRYAIPNVNVDDLGDSASSFIFGVRDEVTKNGRLMVGRTLVELDSDVAHDHTCILVYHPEDGTTPHAALSWAGVIWALTGMNANGKVLAVNESFTLNNAMVRNILDALLEGSLIISDNAIESIGGRLVSRGIPIGIAAREILAMDLSMEEVRDFLSSTDKTFGWNLFMADAPTRKMAVYELDANILNEEEGGVSVISPPEGTDHIPNTLNPYIGNDNDALISSTVFVENVEDLRIPIGGFDVRPQRYWSDAYFSGLNTFFGLKELIGGKEGNYGSIDKARMMEIMKHPYLTDKRNSMHSAVIIPESLELYVAMGGLPSNLMKYHYFNKEDLGFLGKE